MPPGIQLSYLKMKKWTKTQQVTGIIRKQIVVILLSEKVISKPRSIKRNKEGFLSVPKARVRNEEIMFVTIHTPNVLRILVVKQELQETQGHTHENTFTVGEFAHHPSTRIRGGNNREAERGLKNIIDKQTLEHTPSALPVLTAEDTPSQVLA